MKNFFKNTLLFFKRNFIFTISVVVAAVSCFFVPPDSGYADYFEWTPRNDSSL